MSDALEMMKDPEVYRQVSARVVVGPRGEDVVGVGWASGSRSRIAAEETHPPPSSQPTRSFDFCGIFVRVESCCTVVFGGKVSLVTALA